ncbi:hypothetical protein [Streptomyces sp. NPDC004296]|uniref:hypothetical protein n=1 Tax=Streptomyces sp. NPDC004296 TaxID=3364697 RepID=UPI00367AAFB7
MTRPTLPAELWDQAAALCLTGDFPAYGSPQWCVLPLESPARLAAVVDAAEAWRRHASEQARLEALQESDPDAWFREVTADANSEAQRTIRRLGLSRSLDASERAKRRRPLPPHQLRATPGWPPIAVPGRPGHYLTYPADRAAAMEAA